MAYNTLLSRGIPAGIDRSGAIAEDRSDGVIAAVKDVNFIDAVSVAAP
ncbi:hypothetical protein [Martelella mediterranea]|nr:hypothetical protein [uncultured Martelella sp.]